MTLLCFKTIWPILLIEGITDVQKFQNLIQGQHLDELGQVLYFQAAGKQHFVTNRLLFTISFFLIEKIFFVI